MGKVCVHQQHHPTIAYLAIREYAGVTIEWSNANIKIFSSAAPERPPLHDPSTHKLKTVGRRQDDFYACSKYENRTRKGSLWSILCMEE